MYNNNNGDACLVKERNTARRKRAQTGFSGAPKVHLYTIAPGTGALYQNCRLFSKQSCPNLLPIGGVRVCFMSRDPGIHTVFVGIQASSVAQSADPVEIPGCHSLRDMLLWYHGWRRALLGGRRRSTPKRTLSGVLRFGNGPVNPTPADGGRL